MQKTIERCWMAYWRSGHDVGILGYELLVLLFRMLFILIRMMFANWMAGRREAGMLGDSLRTA